MENRTYKHFQQSFQHKTNPSKGFDTVFHKSFQDIQQSFQHSCGITLCNKRVKQAQKASKVKWILRKKQKFYT